tara:strand:+ start:5818 stop:6138 length:321 start_codon:yes stop_codon:yes gene_type:complete
MIYVFDIDGTICSKTDGNYESAEPFKKRIKKINELYKKGETIFFQTARGMGRSGNSRQSAYHEFFELTREQLMRWGVKYDALFMGKPSADFYIDDKGIKDNDFFAD